MELSKIADPHTISKATEVTEEETQSFEEAYNHPDKAQREQEMQSRLVSKVEMLIHVSTYTRVKMQSIYCHLCRQSFTCQEQIG